MRGLEAPSPKKKKKNLPSAVHGQLGRKELMFEQATVPKPEVFGALAGLQVANLKSLSPKP